MTRAGGGSFSHPLVNAEAAASRLCPQTALGGPLTEGEWAVEPDEPAAEA